jgi:hypothetical protein
MALGLLLREDTGKQVHPGTYPSYSPCLIYMSAATHPFDSVAVCSMLFLSLRLSPDFAVDNPGPQVVLMHRATPQYPRRSPKSGKRRFKAVLIWAGFKCPSIFKWTLQMM